MSVYPSKHIVFRDHNESIQPSLHMKRSHTIEKCQRYEGIKLKRYSIEIALLLFFLKKKTFLHDKIHFFNYLFILFD